MRYSDFIVFADESGSADLQRVAPEFPAFALVFCVFRKSVYAAEAVTRVAELKLEYFGHEQINLHEYDIRKKRAPFLFPTDGTREQFMEDIGEMLSDLDFAILPVVVDKRLISAEMALWVDAYGLALEQGLGRVREVLDDLGGGRDLGITHVMIEARGSSEDNRARAAISRIRQADGAMAGEVQPLKALFADKTWNSAGLQIADLVAHPIVRHYLRPEQPNRAWDVIRPKIAPQAGRDGIVVLPGRT